VLDLSPSVMLAEIEAARRAREAYLDPIRGIRRIYCGNHYRSDTRAPHAQPENYLTAWVASIIGAVAFSNPAVRAKSVIGDRARPQARMIESAVNAWIRQACFEEMGMLLCIDTLFGYGVALVAMEDAPAAASADYAAPTAPSGRQRPRTVRVAPERFYWDPRAEAEEACRFVGHEYELDIDDARRIPSFNPAAVASLAADDVRPPDSGHLRQEAGAPERPRVRLYDVYIPEQRALGTIAAGQNGEAVWLREPGDYIGPRQGPYRRYGVYPVPGQVAPLSPVAAALEQFEALNEQERAAAREASTLKNLVLMGTENPDLPAKIIEAPSSGVLQVPGYNPSMMSQITLGGVSPGRAEYIAELKSRADNQSGLSNIRRGTAEQGARTATEISAIQSGADARTSFISGRYTSATADVLRRVAWYLYHSETVSMQIEMQPQGGGPPVGGYYLGGLTPNDQDIDFDEHLAIDIEPYSMRRADPVMEGQQATQLLELIAGTIAPSIQQYPWLRWKEILDDIGEAVNQPDFSSRILPDGQPPMQPLMAQPGAAGQPGAGMPGMPTAGMGMQPGLPATGPLDQRAQMMRDARRMPGR